VIGNTVLGSVSATVPAEYEPAALLATHSVPFQYARYTLVVGGEVKPIETLMDLIVSAEVAVIV
jgi:hypothetical protein